MQKKLATIQTRVNLLVMTKILVGYTLATIQTHSYILVKWSVVYRPKDQGGLGIHDLEVKNIAVLGK